MKVASNFTHYWKQGLSIGLTSTMDERALVHLYVINGFSFVLIAFVVVFNIVFILAGWHDGWSSLSFILVALLTLYFNSVQLFKLAKFTMVVLSLFIILLMAITHRHTSVEYALVTVVCNSVLFYRSIRMIFLSFVVGALCYGFYFWYDHIHVFIPDPDVPYSVVQNLVLLISTSTIMAQSFIFRSMSIRYSDELKAANEEIKTSMEELNSINNHLDEIVMEKSKELSAYIDAINVNIFSVTLSPSGQIISVNERVQEISGYTEKELIGNTFQIFNSGYHTESFFRTVTHKVALGNIWQGEVQSQSKDGKIFWVEMVIIPIKDGNDKVQKLLALALSIGDRKAVEEERNKTIEILESIAFRASHDIRGPITRILGLSYLVNRDMISHQEMKFVSAKFEEAAKELDIVTRDFTAYINHHGVLNETQK